MSAMSFANRGEYYNVSTMVRWYDAELDGKLLEFSRELSSKACAVGEPKKGLALYSNYISEFYHISCGPFHHQGQLTFCNQIIRQTQKRSMGRTPKDWPSSRTNMIQITSSRHGIVYRRRVTGFRTEECDAEI